MKEKLQNHNFGFQTNHDKISSDGNFIKKFVTQIDEMSVDAMCDRYGGDFTSNDMQMLTESLSTTKKVCFVAYLLILFKTF